MRTTKKQIRAKVQGLQERGVDIAVGYVCGRARCTNKKDSRDLSPRLTTSEMAIWLSGFACALDRNWPTKS